MIGDGARRRMLVATLGVSVALSVVPLFFSFAHDARSDRELVEESLGNLSHGPLHLVAEETVGDREWKVFAYVDADGRPCLAESLGGGGCHPHAGRVEGEIADYGVGGGSWEDGGGTTAYAVVRGAVPSHVRAVLVEFGDGTVDRVETHELPGSRVRMFALLSEGDPARTVEDVRAAE